MQDTDTLTVHDARRCPKCTTIGRVDEIETHEHSGNDWERIKYRVLECRDESCGTRWQMYG